MPRKCKVLVRKVYSLGTAFQLIKATPKLQQKFLPRVAERVQTQHSLGAQDVSLIRTDKAGRMSCVRYTVMGLVFCLQDMLEKQLHSCITLCLCGCASSR